jgi:hypothetical protein
MVRSRLAMRLVVLTIALAVGLPVRGGAQGNRRTTLAVTGLPLTATTTMATDFDAGSISLGSVAFTVDLTTNSGGGGFSPRVTTVQLRCGAPCPASGTLAVGSLEWRRADLGTWNALTTTYVTVESRTATFNGTDDPWGNSVFWRYLLAWTSNPPTAATEWRLEFQLTVSAP